jgi:hypothetical protein
MSVGRTERNSGSDRKLETNNRALKQKDLELEKIQTKTQKAAGKEMAKPYRHST